MLPACIAKEDTQNERTRNRCSYAKPEDEYTLQSIE
jgi:hypothetical protein